MREAPPSSRALGVALALGLAGCSAAPPPSPTPPDSTDPPPTATTSAPSPSPSLGPAARAEKRLQGLWEITRYQSEAPIPDKAMPIMGELFDILRLGFEGSTMISSAGPGSEERIPFSIADERGAEFTLVAKGGLFDGARCRIVDDESWEATDHGATWPGVSLLKRAKPADAGAKAKPRAPGPGSGDRPKR